MMSVQELVERFWRDGDTPKNRGKVAAHIARMHMEPADVWGLIDRTRETLLATCPKCHATSIRGGLCYQCGPSADATGEP